MWHNEMINCEIPTPPRVYTTQNTTFHPFFIYTQGKNSRQKYVLQSDWKRPDLAAKDLMCFPSSLHQSQQRNINNLLCVLRKCVLQTPILYHILKSSKPFVFPGYNEQCAPPAPPSWHFQSCHSLKLKIAALISIFAQGRQVCCEIWNVAERQANFNWKSCLKASWITFKHDVMPYPLIVLINAASMIPLLALTE